MGNTSTSEPIYRFKSSQKQPALKVPDPPAIPPDSGVTRKGLPYDAHRGNAFIKNLRENAILTLISDMNGETFGPALILWQDTFTVCARDTGDGREVLFYKHGIVSIRSAS